MPANTKLSRTLALLNDSEKLGKIGSAVLRTAAARAVLNRVSGGSEHPGLVIKKGEMVPASFRERLKIQVDAKGRAVKDWPRQSSATGDYMEVCYEDAGDAYCFCWPDSVDIDERVAKLNRECSNLTKSIPKKKLEQEFSTDELALLRQNRIVPK